MKVGAFALSGLLVMGLVIFLIGDARRLFSSSDEYYATFRDIEGLKPGSPVRMGGLDVGRVRRIDYASDATSDEIRVTLRIVREEARRIREDSVAQISPKGMLGDKLITLTVGAVGKQPLAAGDTIRSVPSSDMLGQIQGMAEKADGVLSDLKETSSTLAEDQFRDDLRQSAASVRNILQTLESGDGYVTRLMSDESEAKKLSRTLSNLENTSARLSSVLSGLDSVLSGLDKAVARVNTGPGLAHEVIYGESGAQMPAQIGQAAEQVALTLAGIREGDGLARNLLFGGETTEASAKVVSDLAAISGDLRAITQRMREGKGTLGALMVDPSVYEDLKVLLGNVQRNEVLRALVRYSIKRDEQSRRVEVRDPESPAVVTRTPAARSSAAAAQSSKADEPLKPSKKQPAAP